MHFCKFRYKKQGLHYSGGSIFNMAVGPKVEILLSEIFNFYGKIFLAFTGNMRSKTFHSEPERIRHRLCMDDLCCAFRELTNRLRSTLSRAKEQSNWLCLLQFYSNGMSIEK